MARRKKVYEGKAKILYEGPEPGTLIQYFKDDGAPTPIEAAPVTVEGKGCLLYTSPSPRDRTRSRMPSSA